MISGAGGHTLCSDTGGRDNEYGPKKAKPHLTLGWPWEWTRKWQRHHLQSHVFWTNGTTESERHTSNTEWLSGTHEPLSSEQRGNCDSRTVVMPPITGESVLVIAPLGASSCETSIECASSNQDGCMASTWQTHSDKTTIMYVVCHWLKYHHVVCDYILIDSMKSSL